MFRQGGTVVVAGSSTITANGSIGLGLTMDVTGSLNINGGQFNLDAVVSATDNPAWATDLLYGDHFLYGTSSFAAAPGYPIIQVPAGEAFGAPMGISFFGTAFSEPTLIKLASGFEAVTHARAKNLPTFAQTVPNYGIQGTTLNPPKNSTVPPANSSKAPAWDNKAPAALTPEQQKKLHHL